MLAKVRTKDTRDPVVALIDHGQFRDAVARCADMYGPALGRFCMALLGSQQDAEEVVQETLIAAHGAMPRYRGEGSVRAWLFGIARRQCARHLEKNGRHRNHLSIVPDDIAGGSGTTKLVAEKRRARSVRSALETLKPSEREVLVLRYQAELSFREIAQACGIEEAAARKRASRGLQRLRTTLSRQEVE